jgi:hypothetical protein
MALTPEQRIARAQRAKDLLQNDLLADAFAMIEQRQIEAWKGAVTTEEREKCWLRLSVASEVRKLIVAMVADEDVAQGEIADALAEAERRRNRVY